MAKSIVGLFDQMQVAQEAVQELIDIGIARDNISLIANDAQGHGARALKVETDEESEEHPAAGAATGAVIGGLAGLLLGLGALAIPGIGPVLAAGPLVAALGGAGLGAVTGGVIGALTQAGVPERDANVFAEGLRRGGTLLLVYASEEQADSVSEVMNRHHPADINERATSWQKQDWNGFNENAEVFAFDNKPETYKARDPQSELDYGPGARTYLAGQSVANYDRGSADMSFYQNAPSDDFRMMESRFRESFEKQYARQPGARWEDYRDSYRYGFDMGHLPQFSNKDWTQVSGELKRSWEQMYPEQDWDHYEAAVHDGFEAGHVPH